MLQSAIFADLQVNNFGIPTVRFTRALPLLSWAQGSFARLSARLRGQSMPTTSVDLLSTHLRRDIGLID